MKNKTRLPLMPRATAVWLVENTGLSFKQIANFCGLHDLEVKGIADGEVSGGIMGMDPVTSGQLDQSEIDRCTKDHNAMLKLKENAAYDAVIAKDKKKKKAKYTPIARRQDKPDAIYWLLKNFPDISDNTVIKLIGTTKSTVEAIRDRSHWNMQNIRSRDPVLLGICSQIDLDRFVEQSRIEPEKAQEE